MSPGHDLDLRAQSVRKRILEVLRIAGVPGHISPAFSIVEILVALYDGPLNDIRTTAGQRQRNRFILSKGHGCLTLYAILEQAGLLPREELDKFCSVGASVGGHPERDIMRGIEATTGALGHGIAIGVGAALGSRITNIPFKVYVLVGDGELNEGSNWEAAFHAVKHKLTNLTIIVDRNQQQCNGPSIDVLPMPYMPELWRTIGFNVHEVDGHSCSEIGAALEKGPGWASAPSVIICDTVKGKGLGVNEGSPEWHHRLPPEGRVSIHPKGIGVAG